MSKQDLIVVDCVVRAVACWCLYMFLINVVVPALLSAIK